MSNKSRTTTNSVETPVDNDCTLMINTKGVEVYITNDRVEELKAKGFTLA